jgi:hypothetical protein
MGGREEKERKRGKDFYYEIDGAFRLTILPWELGVLVFLFLRLLRLSDELLLFTSYSSSPGDFLVLSCIFIAI